jgi:hypothetical protein
MGFFDDVGTFGLDGALFYSDKKKNCIRKTNCRVVTKPLFTGTSYAYKLDDAAELRHYARTKAQQKIHKVYGVALTEGASKIGGPIADTVASQINKRMSAADQAAVTRAEQSIANSHRIRDRNSYRRQHMVEHRTRGL